MRCRIFRILLQGPGGLNKHTEWLIGCPRLVWRGNLQGFCLVDYIFRSAWCSFYPILQVFQLKKPLLFFLNVIHQPNFTFEHGFGAPIFFWIQEKYENTKKSSGPAALYRILTYCASVLVSLARVASIRVTGVRDIVDRR